MGFNGSMWKVEDTIKDFTRLLPMRSCCSFAYELMKRARKLISDKIDGRQEINLEVSREFNSNAQLFLSIEENLCGFLPEDIEYCYAKIEGGNNYNSNLKTSLEKNGGFDIFTFSVDLQLQNSCCHVVRSVGYCSTRETMENYIFLMSVYKEFLENLRDGNELCKIFEAALSFAKNKNLNLAKHLNKEFGFELSHNYGKRSVAIDSNTKLTAQKDTFFVISINLIGLKQEGIEYSLYHSDTVVVRKDQPPRILTSLVER